MDSVGVFLAQVLLAFLSYLFRIIVHIVLPRGFKFIQMKGPVLFQAIITK